MEAFRKAKEITVQGKYVPRPVETFDEAGFPKYVMDEVKAQASLTRPPFNPKAGPWRFQDVMSLASLKPDQARP